MKHGYIFMTMLLLAGALQGAVQDLQIGFDDKGLSSIHHNGVELLKPDYPRFRVFDVNFSDKARRMYGAKPMSERFDAEKPNPTHKPSRIHQINLF